MKSYVLLVSSCLFLVPFPRHTETPRVVTVLLLAFFLFSVEKRPKKNRSHFILTLITKIQFPRKYFRMEDNVRLFA